MEGLMSELEQKLKTAIELLNRTYMTFSELMKLFEEAYEKGLKEEIDKYFEEVAMMQKLSKIPMEDDVLQHNKSEGESPSDESNKD